MQWPRAVIPATWKADIWKMEVPDHGVGGGGEKNKTKTLTEKITYSKKGWAC
jgi:hypothetical protein